MENPCTWKLVHPFCKKLTLHAYHTCTFENIEQPPDPIGSTGCLLRYRQLQRRPAKLWTCKPREELLRLGFMPPYVELESYATVVCPISICWVRRYHHRLPNRSILAGRIGTTTNSLSEGVFKEKSRFQFDAVHTYNGNPESWCGRTPKLQTSHGFVAS